MIKKFKFFLESQEKDSRLYKKGDPLPNDMNGVEFKSFEPPEDWSKVHGQNHSIEEPPLPKTHKKISTGLIIHEPDKKVWLAKPTNEFGGYKYTFPKGQLEPELHPHANAIKEAYEETGLHGHIHSFACDAEGDTSITRYYHATRIGGHPHDHGWESEGVALVHHDDLHSYLNRDRDKNIADKHIIGKPLNI